MIFSIFNRERLSINLRYLLSIYCILLFSITHAQKEVWNYTYGGSQSDIISNIIEARNGDYIFIGYSNSKDGDIEEAHEGYDYWAVRMSADGVILWENKFGGSSDYDFGFALTENEKGEIIIAGSSFSNDGDRSEKDNLGDDDIWVLNLSKDGKIQWHRSFGGSMKDRPVDIQIGKSQEIYVLSNSKSRDNQIKNAFGKQDIVLMKLKTNGKLQWAHPFGGTRDESAVRMIRTKSGGFLILGETESRNGVIKNRRGYQFDGWIMHLDHKGRFVWERTYGGDKDDIIRDALELPDGNFILIGETESFDSTTNKGAFDAWVIRVDNVGNAIWQKHYGGSNIDFVSRLTQDPLTKDIHIFGGTASSDGDIQNKKGSTDIWLLTIDEQGEIKNNLSFGGNSIDEPKDMILDSKGNLILASTTQSEDGSINNLNRYEKEDVWIMKLSPKNNILVENEEKNGVTTIVKTYAGGYLMGCRNSLDQDNHDIFLKQFDPTGFEMFTRTWDTKGNDRIYDITKSNDGTGSYYIAGKTNSNDTIFDNQGRRDDAFLLKLSSTGDIKFVKHYGGSNDDEAKQVMHLNKNDLLLIGNTKSTDGDISATHKGDGDIWIVATDKLGKIKWEKNYGGFGNEVCTRGLVTYRKQIAITGYSNSADADIKHCFGNKDGIFLLLDNEGKIISQSNFGGNGNDWFNDIIQTSDGSFIMVGGTKSQGLTKNMHGGVDYYVVKTTASGRIIWEKTFGGSANDEAMSVIAHSREEFIIAGSSASIDGEVKGNIGQTDAWVIKIDADGKLIDQKSFGKVGDQYCTKMIKLSNFKYLLGGYEIDDNYNEKIWYNQFKF